MPAAYSSSVKQPEFTQMRKRLQESKGKVTSQLLEDGGVFIFSFF